MTADELRPRTAPTHYSPQQLDAIDAIRGWHEDVTAPQVFRAFGYAGTGKTTIAKELPFMLGCRNWRYVAFTGKAAHVLRSKGCAPASTLHSAMYRPKGLEEDDNGKRRLKFEWQPYGDLHHADLIICDEVSMLGEKLAMDLERYGVKILVLGDPAQLPPVKGEGYYMGPDPDVMLTEIHRQALDSPVLKLATRIREGGKKQPGDFDRIELADLIEADQVLCWTNAARWRVLTRIRKELGRMRGIPQTGDRVMCLANNRDLAIYNGQQFEVLMCEISTYSYALTLKDDEGNTRYLTAHREGFLGLDEEKQARNERAGIGGDMAFMTFAQVITVHKSQGSEWANIVVLNDVLNCYDRELRRQLLYTAVTRASVSVLLQEKRVG